MTTTTKENLPIPPVPKKPVTLTIVGAGARGQRYAEYAKAAPEWLKIVAVAEPHAYKRNLMAHEYKIPVKNVFTDWTTIIKGPKLSDAVAICTQDHLHAAPAIAFANAKYNILLEKPMAVSLKDCQDIVEAVKRNNVIFALGFVYRFTSYISSIINILNSKEIGEIVNIQHLEQIGFWHFAHSFVRGNWANESRSTFSLMAKSCHDFDLISYMMGGVKCKRVSSFGSLTHFRKDKKPKEAGKAKKCVDCAYEPKCPFSATKIYMKPFVLYGHTGWPINIVHPNEEDLDMQSLANSLSKSNYGSCVYEVDNDVCDQQVVNMEFENGATVSFSMITFTEDLCVRKTRIFGTRGQIEGNGLDEIKVSQFLPPQKKIVNPSMELSKKNLPIFCGHGGGDFGLMKSFVYACVTGNQDYLLCGPDVMLESHMCVFAAEKSRRSGTVVDIEEFRKSLTVVDIEDLKKPAKNTFEIDDGESADRYSKQRKDPTPCCRNC